MPITKKLGFDKTTILTNEFLQNENISLEAKGLLGYMLSLPDNWDFTIAGISKKTGVSERKIIKILHELEENGYHTKKHIYENGRIKDWVYFIFAEPRQDIIDKTFKSEQYQQDLQNQQCCLQYNKQIVSNNKLLDTKNKQKQKEYIVENEEIFESANIIKKSMLMENVKCIIDYLNESINTKYRYDTKGTINLIKTRFKEGYKLDNFYDVIDKKVQEWKGTDFEQYLRPSTLFGNKFENYLNQTYFKGTTKSSYSSKPTFDNTYGNVRVYHISDEEFNKLTHEEKLLEMEKFDAIANMTPLQKEFHNKYCLARDENGNLLKF